MAEQFANQHTLKEILTNFAHICVGSLAEFLRFAGYLLDVLCAYWDKLWKLSTATLQWLCIAYIRTHTHGMHNIFCPLNTDTMQNYDDDIIVPNGQLTVSSVKFIAKAHERVANE